MEIKAGRALKIWLYFLLVSCSLLTVSSAARADSPESIVINEIHYDPDVKTELVEFIELFNNSTEAVSLGGWQITDAVRYTFPDGAILEPGEYLVIAQDTQAIIDKWPWLEHSQVYGPFSGRLNSRGETVTLLDSDYHTIDQVDYQLGFPWPTVGDPLTTDGSGASIQLLNTNLDNELGGGWRSATPTPGLFNAVFAENSAPLIRQVEHSPRQPKSGETVTITAKITDSNDVQAVRLLYQVVEPGHYIRLHDTEYETLWTVVEMNDDGLDGDAQADDSVFTVRMDSDLQLHRRLIRYRIEAEDTTGQSLRVPYPDDPQPNFAYFVYDMVPAWSGAVRPGLDPEILYDETVMNSLPVYHLISMKSDIEDCTWFVQYDWTSPEASEFNWTGTLVYDGRVYDHICYRTRGGVWRYSMGKNMWKFNFNRGHSLQGRDDYGKEYDTQWDKLNLSACIQQGNYDHRGEQGMFEAVSFKMFNLMGVPASNTHWLQFRIIDEESETGSTQYDGDFWGLYLALEQMDGRFLNEHDLPDGNLYRMNSQSGDELNNQGPTAVDDWSDLYAFRDGYSSFPDPDELWWRTNVNLEHYYGYRCVVEGIHHGDIASGKNYSFYLNPQNGLWSQLPWDVDLTWANNMYGSGEDPFKGRGNIFSHPSILIEYNNRLREFHDLFYNSDQAGQLLDSFAAIIDDPNGGLSIVDADRAMWDYNPIMVSNLVYTWKAGQGLFYQQAESLDFPGMVQIMKDYVNIGPREFDTYQKDPEIPATPIIHYAGITDYAADDLLFWAEPFSDPQGDETFAAMKWRIAEVEPFSYYVAPKENMETVLLEEQSVWRYFKGTQEPSATQGEWRQADFDDSGWTLVNTPIGYGYSGVQTYLDDMYRNYSTIYLRTTFTIDDMNDLENLELKVCYDDAFVAWINGTLVAMGNVWEENLAYNDTAWYFNDGSEFISYGISDYRDFIVEGSNVIAVQVLNYSLSDWDCVFDARIITSEDTEIPSEQPIVSGRPGRYEIQSNWESDEITLFEPEVLIPASAVIPGRTYRVRCRMKDITGRWSHWSAPEQFIVTEPVYSLQEQLRITEIMYNPASASMGLSYDNDAFEFIELTNIGLNEVNLSGLSFTDGISFDFAQGSIQNLSPGQSVLVVKSMEAFVARYGQQSLFTVTGQYQGQLSNGGETIELTDVLYGTVLNFTYDDQWYPLTDGDGYSLELANAGQGNPETLSSASAWQASIQTGGSPGVHILP